jgi:hypothetical protein
METEKTRRARDREALAKSRGRLKAAGVAERELEINGDYNSRYALAEVINIGNSK